MNQQEPRHERSPEAPKKVDYVKVLESLSYIADQGFSVHDLLKQVRDEVIFNLQYGNPNSRETNRLLDVVNDIDAMIKEIENPS
jgi:hypothetical protein